MQIHELNTKALTDPAYVAFDDGTDTYKVEFNDTVESAAQSAVAAADLTQNTVGFTSGDSLSPSGWTSVSQITTNSTLATLFNRISTMVKNVRYIWNLLGSSSFSNVASTLTGAVGNVALPTDAKTLSGAIAEHESDISTLNSKIINRNTATLISGTSGACYYSQIGNIVVFSLVLASANAIAANTDIASGLPRNDHAANSMFYISNNNASSSYFRAILTGDGKIRVSEAVPAGASLRCMGAYLSF